MQSKLNHIFSEIRTRTAYLLLSFFLTSLMAYHKSIQLTHVFLLSFLQHNSQTSTSQDMVRHLIFTDVSEAFSSTISICALFTLFFVLPELMYQLLCFLLPSLYTHERSTFLARTMLLLLCWIYWILFIHRVVIPELSHFFLQFQVDLECLSVAAEPKIFSFVCWAGKIFAIASLLFLVLCVACIGVIEQRFDARILAGWRRSYLWACLVLAALLSPPDPWSQLFLAIVILFISELFIWWCFVYHYADKLTTASRN